MGAEEEAHSPAEEGEAPAGAEERSLHHLLDNPVDQLPLDPLVGYHPSNSVPKF